MATHVDRSVAAAVVVEPVEGGFGLYCRYSGQHQPQPCFVRLDLRDGRLWAGYNPEPGGTAVPMSVWHGVIQEWRIPALKGSAANALLQHLAPLAQSLLDADSTSIEHDGSNFVGRCGDGVMEIQETIEHWCGPDEEVQVMDAVDFYHGLGDDDAQRYYMNITAETTDEELDAIACDTGECDVVEGALEYLTRLRDEAK